MITWPVAATTRSRTTCPCCGVAWRLRFFDASVLPGLGLLASEMIQIPMPRIPHHHDHPLDAERRLSSGRGKPAIPRSLFLTLAVLPYLADLPAELAQMPYADAVLNEVLRMHSVVDGVWRRALEDLTIQGHHIPEVHPRTSLSKQA